MREAASATSSSSPEGAEGGEEGSWRDGVGLVPNSLLLFEVPESAEGGFREESR